MQKFTASENIQIIADVAESRNVDKCLMIAMAKIESGWNNLASNGSYVGLFQLGEGRGGIHGDERLDPEMNTQAAINFMQENYNYINEKLGYVEPWMLYLAHQQGRYGFYYEYTNQNDLLTNAKYYTNMKGNIPKECKGQIYTTGDFLNCWKNKFNEIYSACGGSSITDKANTIVKLMIAGVAGYFIYKYIKKNY